MYLMPNDYFQFKQFLIMQDKCAMKVCTDACLFGSLIPALFKAEERKKVLDIGTGTGLLSLMYAQKNDNAFIDAVEIDEAAAKQAEENFKASGWNERLNIYHRSVQQFADVINKKYDIIICNPPFYKNDLKSIDTKRNLALHSDALSLEELIFIVKKLLADDGGFFMLLPYHRTKEFEILVSKYNLFVKEKVLIKQTPKHDYFRVMLWVERKGVDYKESEIIIMDNRNEYSERFKQLLRSYYLEL